MIRGLRRGREVLESSGLVPWQREEQGIMGVQRRAAEAYLVR